MSEAPAHEHVMSAGLLEMYMLKFQLTKEQVLEQKAAFDQLDEDGSGTISLSEVEAVNMKLQNGFTREELVAEFKQLDVDGNGAVSFQEFLKVYVHGEFGRDVSISVAEDEKVVSDLKPPPRQRHSTINDLGAIEEDEDDQVDSSKMEMKLSQKNNLSFYVRAAIAFLKGVEAKEGSEAKKPVDELRLSALGGTISIAVAVATRLEAEGIGKITNVVTSYPEMQSTRGPTGCPQFVITMVRAASS